MNATKAASVCALAIATVLLSSTPSAAQTAPTLYATVTGSRVSAQWTPVAGALGYLVSVGSAPGVANIGEVPVPASMTSFSVDAPPGVYFIRVRGFAGPIVGDFSNEVAIAVAQPSLTPTLTAQVVGNQVTLQWTGVAGAQGYTVVVGTAPGAADIGAMNVPATTTSLSTPAPDGVYYIRVRGFAGSLIGPFSNEVVATVGGPCVVPTEPIVTASVNGGTVILNWTGGAGARLFQVQWSRFPGQTELTEQTTSTSHSKWIGVAGTFYARVVAISPCGSTTSAEVSATIESIPKRYLSTAEISSILNQVRVAYPRAWSLAHRSSTPERWDYIILASRYLFQLSGGTIGANWRRARVGDLSMDGLSVENPADQRYYFADAICGAGGPSPSVCYSTPFQDSQLLREYAGGPYAPHGFANPMTLRTHFNYGAAGGW
jgi:hypothetical protein